MYHREGYAAPADACNYLKTMRSRIEDSEGSTIIMSRRRMSARPPPAQLLVAGLDRARPSTYVPGAPPAPGPRPDRPGADPNLSIEPCQARTHAHWSLCTVLMADFRPADRTPGPWAARPFPARPAWASAVTASDRPPFDIKASCSTVPAAPSGGSDTALGKSH